MNEVDVVRPHSRETLLNDFFVASDGRANGEMPDRGAELGRQEDLISPEALERATNGEFAAVYGVVGGGIDIVDAAIECTAHDLPIVRAESPCA